MDIIIRDGQPLTQDAKGAMHRSSVAELVAEIQQLRTRIVELEATLLKVEDDSRDRSAQLHALQARVDQLAGQLPTRRV